MYGMGNGGPARERTWSEWGQKMVKKAVTKGMALAYNMTEIEIKVLDATNEEAWGPHGQAMAGEQAARCSRPVAASFTCKQVHCAADTGAALPSRRHCARGGEP